MSTSEETKNIALDLHNLFHLNPSAGIYIEGETLMVFPKREVGVRASDWFKTISMLHLLAEKLNGLVTIREVKNKKAEGMVYFVNLNPAAPVECSFTQQQREDLSFSKKKEG